MAAQTRAPRYQATPTYPSAATLTADVRRACYLLGMKDKLDELKDWLGLHNAAVMAVLFLSGAI